MENSEYIVKGSSFDGEEQLKAPCTDEATAWEIAKRLYVHFNSTKIEIWQNGQILHNHKEVMEIIRQDTQIFVLNLEELFKLSLQKLDFQKKEAKPKQVKK